MIGIDIESISRIDHLFSKKKKLLQRMFNKYEWEYAIAKAHPSQTLTGIWCAKEAVVKALAPYDQVFIKDICIQHKPSGQPYLVLKSETLKIENIHISISHSKDYATAVAIVVF